MCQTSALFCVAGASPRHSLARRRRRTARVGTAGFLPSVKPLWLHTALGNTVVMLLLAPGGPALVAPILAGRLAGLAASHDNGVA